MVPHPATNVDAVHSPHGKVGKGGAMASALCDSSSTEIHARRLMWDPNAPNRSDQPAVDAPAVTAAFFWLVDAHARMGRSFLLRSGPNVRHIRLRRSHDRRAGDVALAVLVALFDWDACKCGHVDGHGPAHRPARLPPGAGARRGRPCPWRHRAGGCQRSGARVDRVFAHPRLRSGIAGTLRADTGSALVRATSWPRLFDPRPGEHHKPCLVSTGARAPDQLARLARPRCRTNQC